MVPEEKMYNRMVKWEIDDDNLSIKVSIDGEKWFYPKESFFKSRFLPPKLKKAYKEVCEEKRMRRIMDYKYSRKSHK